VDQLGGFQYAVQRARALAGIDEDARVQLRFYPEVESPFEAFGKLFGASGESVEALLRINAILSDPRAQRAFAALREEEAGVRAESEAPRIR
jgi:protease-4